jgi:hypothetical protein
MRSTQSTQSTQPSKLPAGAVYCFCIILFASIIGLLIAILVITCQIKNGMLTLAELMLSPIKVGRSIALEEGQTAIDSITLINDLLLKYTNGTCGLACNI